MQSAPTQEPIIFGLLNACLENLRSQGMSKMFIDGVANDAAGLLAQFGEHPNRSLNSIFELIYQASENGPNTETFGKTYESE